jgi:AsmA protein
LKLVDADLTLGTGSLIAQKISIGKSALIVEIKNGKLTADLTEMALYQGAGTGQIVADASGAVPALTINAKLDHVAAQPFLKDAMGVERLSGTGAFDLALTSHGHSQRELISGLNGKGAVTFTDGAIQGIDLAAMARNVSTAFLDSGSAAKTDFTSLGGTFTVTNGIVKNDDLDMKSPLIRMSGAGTVDLPKRLIDYKITPKIVASAQGQGAAGNETGLSVPVLVQGPLDRPSYKPDVAALLQQNPQQLLKALKPGAAPANGQPATKPLDQLKGLLGH